MREFLTAVNRQKEGIWRYADLLPEVGTEHQITMGEGGTPLIASRRIAAELGLSSLYFKLEGSNPTGSYKDRISALGVSRALQRGRVGCIGTSSGNAGASAAAYAARAGLPYALLVLEQIAETKLMQAALHDAQIIKVKGFGTSAEVGDRVFRFIEEQAESLDREVMITAFRYNPVAMEAVKTIAFELLEKFGEKLPDAVFAPVGGGGLFTGIWKGFKELHDRQWIGRMPLMAAVQSEGCSNIARAWQAGDDRPAPGDSTSGISGLQVPNPPDGELVLKGLKEDGGFAVAVSDEEAWAWQERLAAEEGIWCEPAAAVSLAGVKRALDEGRLTPGGSAVCILTGAGYKDVQRGQAMLRAKSEIPLLGMDELISTL